jgi:hypothetical protein
MYAVRFVHCHKTGKRMKICNSFIVGPFYPVIFLKAKEMPQPGHDKR